MTSHYIDAARLHLADPHAVEGVDGGGGGGCGGGGDGRGGAYLYAILRGRGLRGGHLEPALALGDEKLHAIHGIELGTLAEVLEHIAVLALLRSDGATEQPVADHLAILVCIDIALQRAGITRGAI